MELEFLASDVDRFSVNVRKLSGSYNEQSMRATGTVSRVGEEWRCDGCDASIGANRLQADVNIVIGPGTEAIAGEGRILTTGGFDSHIHFICPQQIDDALHSGLTTMLGGGTGPAHGTLATTCTPGTMSGLPSSARGGITWST